MLTFKIFHEDTTEIFTKECFGCRGFLIKNNKID